MFSWYFSDIVSKAIIIFRSVLTIVINAFSLPVLLKTLFAPWRKDIAPLEGSLEQIFHRAIDNLISRFFGFTIRLFTILAGLAVLIATGILGIAAIGLLSLFAIFPPGTLIIYLVFEHEKAKHPPKPYPLKQISQNKEIKEDVLLPYIDYKERQIYQKKEKYQTFLWRILQNPRMFFVLNHLGLTKQSILDITSSSLEPQKILTLAAQNCPGNNIAAPDLFLACLLLDNNLQKAFERISISQEDVKNVVDWERAFYLTISQPSPLLNPSFLRSSGGIGRFWSSGYTPTLDHFSREIGNSTAAILPIHFEAHKNTISEIETILGRLGKHNVILVGEPGTGKRTVALGFANKVLIGQTIPSLAHNKVIEFNLDALLAGSESLGETEERLVAALNEAVSAGNIILFVDNIERLFEGSKSKPGVIDLSAIMLPYLERNDFQLISTTSFEGYHKWIEPNTTLASNFEKIEIKESSKEEALKILEETSLYLESKEGILILYQALKEIVDFSDKYLGEKKFPEKAIDLLDETSSYLINSRQGKILTQKEVEEVVSVKTKVPVGKLEKTEKEKLINLEEIMHKRLVNQDEAVKEIASCLRRVRAGVKSSQKPVGSFLFLGPTGVGKTESAKTLAEAYFGDENRMLRFDMTEFKEENSISRLIGTKTGEPGLLTSKIREAPFSLLLLDEIEKASLNVLNIFLQILDEGKITDSLGHEVNFKNTIIIATSNAGSEWIREQIQAVHTINKNQLMDFLLKRNLFRPEFLNRFDAVVAFRPLLENELEKVVDLLIKKIEEGVKDKQIKIVLEPKARQKLAHIGFDPQFGARALQRTIQEKVENRLADAILKDELKPGGVFTISEEMI